MRIDGNRLTTSGAVETVSLEIVDGQIRDVRIYGAVDHDAPTLLPGFIDVHVHGGGGADTMDATADAFATMVQTHARHGTTGLLLTTVTESPDRMEDVLSAATRFMEAQPGGRGGTGAGLAVAGGRGSGAGAGAALGARVLGVHLEGPFIHPDRAGAQRPDKIIEPNMELAERWFSSGIVRLMTMAPERPHALDVARIARKHGVITSVGHTTASYDEVAAGKDAGYSHVTHLCNAMPALLHRAPGPIGYLVEDQDFTGDLICDGIHVSGPMVKTLVRAVGVDRLLLITDAIRAADMPDGAYDLGGLPVTVKDGACRLEDGTLAGSVLTMDRAYHMVQRLAGVSRFEAQQMASVNAARRLGLSSKGKLEPGFDADIAVMNADGEVLRTVVGGQTVYEA